jgi:hypothetical protein
LSFLRHKKIYQSDGLKRELNCSFSSLTDHRSDESSTGYSFMSCSPAELMSASPAPNSFSLNLVAVKPAAANHNCPSFSLSQPKGPYHGVPYIPHSQASAVVTSCSLHRAAESVLPLGDFPDFLSPITATNRPLAIINYPSARSGEMMVGCRYLDSGT